MLLATSCFASPPDRAAQTGTIEYHPSWESVEGHNAVPEWFQDAKFGIYFWWGPYTVPEYGSEWYPNYILKHNNDGGRNCYSHHLQHYGDPFRDWPYHYFITGAKDKTGKWVQFAPKLKSEGGYFDPDEWAQLFQDAGARFAGFCSEHHDGYSLWNSKVNEWNSVNFGPKLDLTGLYADAVRRRGLKFAVIMGHAPHFNGYYQSMPPQTDPSLKKLYAQLPREMENELWQRKLEELVDQYTPDLIWQDFNMRLVDTPRRLNFLSYYYNKAQEWNREVVTVYKDGFTQSGSVLNYEKGGPDYLTSYYWLSGDPIAERTWSYVKESKYYSKERRLHSFIDRVSKNGSFQLCINPKPDGTIPDEQREILLAMGDWLRRFGESIYSTRAWVKFGEGPTKMGGGEFAEPVLGTPKDIRFTRTKDGTTLYAIALGWPGDRQTLTIASLGSEGCNISTLQGVSLLGWVPGHSISLDYEQDREGLKVKMPESAPYEALAYPFRLKFSGKIPDIELPPADPYQQIEAETFAVRSGGASAERVRDNRFQMSLGVIRSGDHVIYRSFDFKNGANACLARISCTNASTLIEVRLDKPDGPLLGMLRSVNTGDMSSFKTISSPVSQVNGVHDICLVFRSEENLFWTSLFLNWFRFQQAGA